MADPAPLDELIARLEKATGPSRMLDAEIAQALGWEECGGAWRETPTAQWSMFLPQWSASLDAALELSDGAYWEISGPRKYLNIPSPVPNYWRATLVLWEPMREFDGWGATAPLALCIAALRARARAREGGV